MSFTLKILREARKELDKLDNTSLIKIYPHLEELKKDPFRPRPTADITKIKGNRKPPAYRLRIGRIRVEYLVLEDERQIIISKIFTKRRGSNYR
jgi:mRNA-degrading endonuclease RelE of RelBE toxin-antitoxin system